MKTIDYLMKTASLAIIFTLVITQGVCSQTNNASKLSSDKKIAAGVSAGQSVAAQQNKESMVATMNTLTGSQNTPVSTTVNPPVLAHSGAHAMDALAPDPTTGILTLPNGLQIDVKNHQEGKPITITYYASGRIQSITNTLEYNGFAAYPDTKTYTFSDEAQYSTSLGSMGRMTNEHDYSFKDKAGNDVHTNTYTGFSYSGSSDRVVSTTRTSTEMTHGYLTGQTLATPDANGYIRYEYYYNTLYPKASKAVRVDGSYDTFESYYPNSAQAKTVSSYNSSGQLTSVRTYDATGRVTVAKEVKANGSYDISESYYPNSAQARTVSSYNSSGQLTSVRTYDVTGRQVRTQDMIVADPATGILTLPDGLQIDVNQYSLPVNLGNTSQTWTNFTIEYYASGRIKTITNQVEALGYWQNTSGQPAFFYAQGGRFKVYSFADENYYTTSVGNMGRVTEERINTNRYYDFNGSSATTYTYWGATGTVKTKTVVTDPGEVYHPYVSRPRLSDVTEYNANGAVIQNTQYSYAWTGSWNPGAGERGNWGWGFLYLSSKTLSTPDANGYVHYEYNADNVSRDQWNNSIGHVTKAVKANGSYDTFESYYPGTTQAKTVSSYSSSGQLNSVRTYDVTGRVTKLQQANGSYIVFQYNNRGRLTDRLYYDANGRLMRRSEHHLSHRGL